MVGAMGVLTYTTAGESHGEALVGILSGMPAGLELSAEDIDPYLKRRQKAGGRGVRSHRIERDHARILSGVWRGATTGAPIAVMIENMERYPPHLSSPTEGGGRVAEPPHPSLPRKGEGTGAGASVTGEGGLPGWTVPRPGHADYAGARKYDFKDITPVAERASARETAMRTALGAVALKFIDEFGIYLMGFTRGGGTAWMPDDAMPQDWFALREASRKAPFYCPHEPTAREIKTQLDAAAKAGTTLGGCFEVQARSCPPGLGSFVEWDKRLDARLAAALMSIPSVKAVEIGDGIASSKRLGRDALDAIYPGRRGEHEYEIKRETNHAGGIEGGMTNGETVVVRAFMKPVPTQKIPLDSMDLRTHEPESAPYVRSDTFVVPAASVVGEAVVALVLADALLEMFCGPTVDEIINYYGWYLEQVVPR